jgi:type IV secretory pathway VirB10-like protein
MAVHGLREVRGLCAVAGLVWVLAALSGCASAQAKSSADKLPLDVPPPPPHVIELPAQPLEPVGEIPSPTDPGASPRPPVTKPPQTKPERPDTPPAQPATPAETPAPALPPPAPAPQLRTPETADTSAAAKVHATIDHARSSLNSVNFQLLNNERKKAYNDVKQYCDQAEDALKEGNIVYAQAVATKAEKLALELAGR